jgi:hypothetical protein
VEFPESSRYIRKTSKELEVIRTGLLDDREIETATEERNSRKVGYSEISAEGGKWIQKPRYGRPRTIDEIAKPSELKQFRAIILLSVSWRGPSTGSEK